VRQSGCASLAVLEGFGEVIGFDDVGVAKVLNESPNFYT